MSTILIIEDDEQINFILSQILEKKGHETDSVLNGIDAIAQLEHKHYDLILLDLMLPDLSGERILEHIRKKSPVPVIVISAVTQLEEKVNILQLGADDFINKPFYIEEVLARVEAVLRRYTNFSEEEASEILSYKDILLDNQTKCVLVNQKALCLTAKEFNILYMLMKKPTQVYTKQLIFESVWQDTYFGEDNTINVHISNIRRKLEEHGTYSSYIDTVWGLGYKMSV